MKKVYTVRDQLMNEILKFIQNKEYEINTSEYFNDINVGRSLENEFGSLIENIEYFYEAYDRFDFVTFTNKLPKFAKLVQDIYETYDMRNPFIEKEPIITCEPSVDEVSGDSEIEFWQSELHG